MNDEMKKQYDFYKRNSKIFSAKFSELVNSKTLTTPPSIDLDVAKFCSSISDEIPIFIDVTPELWSRFQCCNLNVKEYCRINGGEMICGYKIWMVPGQYIEGERHAVWKGDSGYKDITFNVDGEIKIAFVADVKEKKADLELNKQKIRRWINPKNEALVRAFNYFESLNPPVPKDSEDDQWRGMLTYENFLKGNKPLRAKNGQWSSLTSII